MQMKIKLSNKAIPKGVYNLNVYAKGTKSGSNGEEYSYYEEVSEDDLAQIVPVKYQVSVKVKK